jgi:hypothetical protein
MDQRYLQIIPESAGRATACRDSIRFIWNMGDAIYAIDQFPDDDLLWRIEWIGGVRYNSSVPSEPLSDVCLAQLPNGETNPLNARSRFSETKMVVKIGVGFLPHVTISRLLAIPPAGRLQDPEASRRDQPRNLLRSRLLECAQACVYPVRAR